MLGEEERKEGKKARRKEERKEGEGKEREEKAKGREGMRASGISGGMI